MPLLADAADSLTVLARVGEVLAGLGLTVASAYHVVRGYRQDLRKRDIDLNRSEQEAKDEHDGIERERRREERDHVIEELRGLIDEAREEAREVKREQKRSQSETAKRIADTQAAHHECEKRTAAQDVQIAHLTELLRNTRAELAGVREELARRIGNLENRNGDAPPSEGDRGRG